MKVSRPLQRHRALLVLSGLVLAVVLAVQTPDVNGENIGTWYFGKRFFEDFTFLNWGKSPLYQLYLAPFARVPFPHSIVLEAIVSAFLCFIPAALLMTRIFGLWIGLLAVALAAPDILLVVPATQAFAMALCMLALYVRIRDPFPGLSSLSLSYALLFLAWPLRSNFILILAFVAAWDLAGVWRAGRLRLPEYRPSLRRHLPLVLTGVLLLLMAVNQSPHRWNNYFIADEKWIPPKGQIAKVVSANVSYNYRERVPDVGGITFDIFFMHKKLFGDNTGIIGMVQANPGELGRYFARNFRALFTTAVSMTAVGQTAFVYTTFGRSGFEQTAESLGVLDHRTVTVAFALVLGGLFILMVRGCWADPARRLLMVFLVGFALLALVSAVLAKGDTPRYVFMFYVVYMVMGAYYAERLWRAGGNWLARRRGEGDSPSPGTLVMAAIPALIVVGLLTQGGWARPETQQGWGGIFQKLKGIKGGGFEEIFYAGGEAPMYRLIEANRSRCRGVMSWPPRLHIGAFSGIADAKLYSLYEIPPFGKWGDSPYTGLREERINCIYLSTPPRATSLGSATNVRVRYDNYVRPYVEYLLSRGARTLPTETGKLIILDGRP